jgi:hypothetical protein
MGKEKFMFFQNFKETADKLPPELRLKFYDALTDYVFYGKESEDPVISALVNAFKPSLTKEDGRKNNGGNHNPKGVNQYTKSGQSLVNSGQSCSIPLETETETENTPPIIPPKGDPDRFISLWNILSDEFRKRYPGNRPIPRLSSGREVPDLYRRTQDLVGLLKDLKRDPAFATEFEEKYEDAWSWAFHQMWQCITESQFLRGETKPNEQHPKPFVFKVSFVMRKKNFMALISPNDPTYKRCQV